MSRHRDKPPTRSDLDEVFRLAKMRPLIKWEDILRSDAHKRDRGHRTIVERSSRLAKIRPKITWVDILRSKMETK